MHKRTFPTCGYILLTAATAFAQVSSHAPTVLKQAPAQAPASAAQLAADRPVVRVNDTTLTNTDLLREEYAIFPYARQHNGGLPREMAAQIRTGALKMIVFEELVYQEAKRRKLTIPPAKLQRAELDFRKQFTSQAEFNNYLQSEFHGSPVLLRKKIERSLLIDSFLRSAVEAKSRVSEAEARTYFEKNHTAFENPEMYTFQTISVLPPAKATPQQLKEGQKRAEEYLVKAKAAKSALDFGLLAEKLSDDDYRVELGQHKPVPVDQLMPPVLAALRTMKPGEVSNVIQVDQAYTIIRLNKHTPAGKSRFEDLKVQLEKQLQPAKREQIRAALDKQLRQNATIQEF